MAVAGLLIAISSPLFGAVADYEGRRKPWIAIFAGIAIIAGFFLWFSKPSPDYVMWTLSWVVLGVIGVEVSVVFYNVMLRDLAPKNYIGRISGWGWGLGYFGGLTCLVIALLVFVHGDTRWLGLNRQTFEHIRITGPFVSIWYFIFAIPLFVWTKDRSSSGISYRKALSDGANQLLETLRKLPRYKEILKFLIARMIYTDGLNTIFAFGGIYAAGTFGMSFTEVIQFGISLNVAAGIGAIGFAWLDDYIGPKPTILISLLIMFLSGVGILIVHSKLAFWILGMVLSLCVGPVQAASRSLIARAAPPELVAEMFGLYAFSGKATAFIGPWLVGAFTLFFDSQRIGMSSVLAFLLVGGIILCFVRAPTTPAD
ncbi:MFS transporter [Candidiatus Paracoxiella cheracis]|uniref:MFS transporter n=1 Tax=Candidiatus Paracoxiella cheracis TaxID=3405120 RepID=UPI003BF5420B